MALSEVCVDSSEGYITHFNTSSSVHRAWGQVLSQEYEKVKYTLFVYYN